MVRDGRGAQVIMVAIGQRVSLDEYAAFQQSVGEKVTLVNGGRRQNWRRDAGGGGQPAEKSWRVETQARTFKPSSSHWKLACLA